MLVIFDLRTAFPYLFGARNIISADYAYSTYCASRLLASQYTAYAVCT